MPGLRGHSFCISLQLSPYVSSLTLAVANVLMHNMCFESQVLVPLNNEPRSFLQTTAAGFFFWGGGLVVVVMVKCLVLKCFQTRTPSLPWALPIVKIFLPPLRSVFSERSGPQSPRERGLLMEMKNTFQPACGLQRCRYCDCKIFAQFSPVPSRAV